MEWFSECLSGCSPLSPVQYLNFATSDTRQVVPSSSLPSSSAWPQKIQKWSIGIIQYDPMIEKTSCGRKYLTTPNWRTEVFYIFACITVITGMILGVLYILSDKTQSNGCFPISIIQACIGSEAPCSALEFLRNNHQDMYLPHLNNAGPQQKVQDLSRRTSASKSTSSVFWCFSTTEVRQLGKHRS